MKEVILHAKNISKSYQESERNIDVLKDVELTVCEGETLAILGASGSGKSTLLHILSTLDLPDKGEIRFKNNNLNNLSTKQSAEFRNKHLGFVYQFHHLLPEFSALENVAMPLLIGGQAKKTAYQRAESFIERVGIQHRINNKPNQLSGGERQRVAIARALVNKPSLIMADEPTGNLDDETSAGIIELIKEINTSDHTSFVIVTHDLSLASQLDRTLTIKNGQIVK